MILTGGTPVGVAASGVMNRRRKSRTQGTGMSRLLLPGDRFRGHGDASVGGCQSRPACARSAVPQTPIGYIHRPTIDLSHGGRGLSPSRARRSRDQRRARVADEGRLRHPRSKDGGARRGDGRGDSPTRLDALTIDLTGSTVKSELITAPGAHTLSKSVSKVHVDRLTYVADPLKYDAFAAGIRMEGR
jgi:hypothetical protein